MWFKRTKDGILTSTSEKKETPEGLWYKCTKCKQIIPARDHAINFWVCSSCGHHERIGSEAYFRLLFDKGKYKRLNFNISAVDALQFKDSKPYTERLEKARETTGLKDAVETAYGQMHGREIIIACMDFSFIGGSMGTVVGTKIAKAIDHAIRFKKPFIMISKSGGARMMEGAFSLMQMAKTSAKLTLLEKAGLPYISVLTDPTTGGVTASFAMLGDVNIAEPNALIGFAGPRVVKETIKTDLPEGFQRSEFLLEHGFLDYIVERKDLKNNIANLLSMLMYKHNGNSKSGAK